MFISAAFTGGVGMGEIDRYTGSLTDLLILAKFDAAIRGQGLPSRWRQNSACHAAGSQISGAYQRLILMPKAQMDLPPGLRDGLRFPDLRAMAMGAACLLCRGAAKMNQDFRSTRVRTAPLRWRPMRVSPSQPP